MRTTFESLSAELRQAIERMGFEKPTPIQEMSIPRALEGRNLLIQARTGTGKTGAFGIPLIERLGLRERALILAPTRELAIQIRDHLRELSYFKRISVFAFYGGTPPLRDVQMLKKRVPQVVVGTPGRIKDLISRGALKTDSFRFLVLDEVDVMLDMGFREDIEWILSRLPSERQSFFVSATVPPEIREIARKFMGRGFLHLSADPDELKPVINEITIKTGSEEQKFSELLRILRENGSKKTIIFVRMRRDAKNLSYKLRREGLRVGSLHGDLTQRRREEVMERFRRGSLRILVATDVASRGLDIEGVSLIINFHLPEDPRVYIHRIGRTGRLGRKGTAINLVSPSERQNLWRIERHKEQVA
jgi:ATP-dependent RNA helicase DeaD